MVGLRTSPLPYLGGASLEELDNVDDANILIFFLVYLHAFVW